MREISVAEQRYQDVVVTVPTYAALHV